MFLVPAFRGLLLSITLFYESEYGLRFIGFLHSLILFPPLLIIPLLN